MMFINEGEETKLNENIRYISRQASAQNYQRLCTIAVYKLASAINYQCYPFLQLYHNQVYLVHLMKKCHFPESVMNFL